MSHRFRFLSFVFKSYGALCDILQFIVSVVINNGVRSSYDVGIFNVSAEMIANLLPINLTSRVNSQFQLIPYPDNGNNELFLK